MNSRTNLIALHGWAMGPAVFDSLDMVTGNRFDLVTPALPGYPASAWPSRGSLQQQTQQMAAVLPEGHLLGWSLGGIYALDLYCRFPQQFSGLTLVCFNPCFVRCKDWVCGVDAAVFDRFAGDLAHGWQATVRRFLALQLHGQADARARVRDLTTALSRQGIPDNEILLRGLELLKQSDCRNWLFSLERPVQMVFSGNDSLVPVDCARQISQIAPWIQVECIAGGSHLPFLSHTEQFIHLLLTAPGHQ